MWGSLDEAHVTTFEPKSSMNQRLTLFLLLSVFIFSACRDRQQASLAKNSQEGPENKVIRYYSKSDAVRDGFLDAEGILWFITNNEGLYRYDGTTFKQYTTDDGLCSNYISAITEDSAGNLWLGTDKGLCRFDKKDFTQVPIPWDGNEDLWGEGMNANLVICLLTDTKGQIWLGTWGNGVHRFDPLQRTSPENYTFSSFLQEEGSEYEGGTHRNVIQSIIEDKAGNIWLTSMSHAGVSRYDGTNFRHFTIADGLSDDMVFSALQDKAGNLWFGMLGNRNGGLDRYDGKSFTHYHKSDGLCSNNIVCMFEDRSGRLWLGSQRGELCILSPDPASPTAALSVAPFTTSDGQTFDHIRFVTEDADGNIWFGGNFGRLFRYDGTELTDFTQKAGS